jgi:hypothetical protein
MPREKVPQIWGPSSGSKTAQQHAATWKLNIVKSRWNRPLIYQYIYIHNYIYI